VLRGEDPKASVVKIFENHGGVMKTVLKCATVLAVAGALALAMSTSSEAKAKKRVHRVGPVAAAALAAGGFYYGPGGYRYAYGPWASYAYAPGPYAYASGAYAYEPGPLAYDAADVSAYEAYAAVDVNGYLAYAYSPGFYASAGMSCVTQGQPGKPLDYANCY
jgi:hypothetical protein